MKDEMQKLQKGWSVAFENFANSDAEMMELDLHPYNITARFWKRSEPQHMPTPPSDASRKRSQMAAVAASPRPKRRCVTQSLPPTEPDLSDEEEEEEEEEYVAEEPRARKPSEKENQMVKDQAYALMRKSLSKYHFDLELKDLPQPDDLTYRPRSKIDDEDVPASVEKIGRGSNIVRAMYAELRCPDGPRHREIVSNVFHSRACHDYHCKHTQFRYCACARKHFLHPLSEVEIKQRLYEMKERRVWHKLTALCYGGLDADVYGEEEEDLDDSDLPKKAPYYDAVAEAVEKFTGDLKTLYQHMNVIAALCSPSSLVEALLLSRSRRPSCSLKLWDNDVAREYLEYHPYIKKIHSEVDSSDKAACMDIYEALFPLFEMLTDVRQLAPLSLKEGNSHSFPTSEINPE